MASQGHGYLGELTPAIVVLALSAILGRLGAAASGRRPDPGRGAWIGRSAIAFAVALAAIFAVQELVEGAVFAGHSGGAAAVFGGGGWLALPLALVVGLLASLADRVLAGAEAVLAARGRRRRVGDVGPPPGAPASRVESLLRPLAFGLARRPPPAPVAS